MKIFLGEGVTDIHSLVFEMSPDWEIVSDTNFADALIIVDNNGDDLEPIRRCYRSHQVLIVQEIFHMGEYMSYEFYCMKKDKFKPITDKVIIIHNNLSYRDCPLLVYNDHIFDRQKLYCTEYDSGVLLDRRVWTMNCTKEMYELHPINKILGRKYLALMRVYHSGPAENKLASRMVVREHIRSLLNRADTYMSDDHTTLFLPNGVNEDVTMCVRREQGGNWYPVSNELYDSSLVSVYSETLVEHSYHNSDKNLATIITEKTFDPMIRGNFILPFGYPGLIKDLIEIYGFKLPDWIDYSYDIIINDADRLEAYDGSIKKLDQYSTDEMYALCIRDLHILDHNRSIFFSRPYSFMDLHAGVIAAITENESVDWNLKCLSV